MSLVYVAKHLFPNFPWIAQPISSLLAVTKPGNDDCWLPLNSTEDKAISVDATVAAILSEIGGILRLKGGQKMAPKAFLLFVDNMFSPNSDCLWQVMLNPAVHHSS